MGGKIKTFDGSKSGEQREASKEKLTKTSQYRATNKAMKEMKKGLLDLMALKDLNALIDLKAVKDSPFS
ncbi:MAG: hypothetical protein LBT62_08100 [Deltaproteobacteria bacterium]|jgi:hypothetical protein|nr:hypothetical protein [Deltaproteobacteria bacterium]